MSQLSSFCFKINVVGKAAGILTITLKCLHKHNKLKGKHFRIKYATNIMPLTYQRSSMNKPRIFPKSLKQRPQISKSANSDNFLSL